jgi:hypothetical protein
MKQECQPPYSSGGWQKWNLEHYIQMNSSEMILKYWVFDLNWSGWSWTERQAPVMAVMNLYGL